MHVVNPWNSYRKIATQTAPPGQLVLMLYEGALSSLERAKTGFASDDPAESNMLVNNNIQKAQEIIRELNHSLNVEQGGECATTLRRLYNYFDNRLWESNLKKEPTGVVEIIRHLTILRDAWATMLNKQGTPDALPSTMGSLVAA